MDKHLKDTQEHKGQGEHCTLRPHGKGLHLGPKPNLGVALRDHEFSSPNSDILEGQALRVQYMTSIGYTYQDHPNVTRLRLSRSSQCYKAIKENCLSKIKKQ
ncbi:hypothetical protein CR513_22354, partial [Mucuna pruriens]